MPITLVGSVQNSADSATGWNTGSLEGELSYQGSGSVGGKAGSGTTRFTHTGTARNFTSGGGNDGDHIIVILGSLTPGKLDTKVNGGLAIIAGNDTVNYGEWYVDGSDTKSPTSLFLPYIVDPSTAFDGAFGTFTTGGNPAQLSAADTFGGRFDATSGIMGNFNNALVDQITIGTGLRGTGTGGTLAEWVTADEGTSANRYGYLTTREGVVYFQGKMYFGSSGSSYTFADADKVLIFPDVPVATDFFEIIVENASSDVEFDGFTIQAPGTPKVALTYISGTWDIINSTIDGARVITGGTGMTLSATKITNSGAITQNGAAIDGCTIINSTAAAALIIDDAANLTDSSLSGNDIAIDGTAAIIADEINLDGVKFSGNTTDVTIDDANDIIINNLNGSNATTCTNTGAGTCSIVTAVTITLTNLVPGSRVYIVNTTDSVVIENIIEATTTYTKTINYTADKGLLVRVRNASGATKYKTFQNTGTLSSSGFSLNVTQELD